MTETRARRRIRKAVQSRGHEVESIDWEPWYLGGEMEGTCGGWLVTTLRDFLPNTSPGNECCGYDVEQTLAHIDWAMPTPEPCACERPAHHFPLSNTKVALHKGMHDPECRWFIRYRLPWWKETP